MLSLLFGKPECLFVVGGKRSSFDIDVEDNVSILMKFKKDGYEFSSTLNMSFVQKTPHRSIRILGEHGNILWDILEGVISINNYTDNLSEIKSFCIFSISTSISSSRLSREFSPTGRASIKYVP